MKQTLRVLAALSFAASALAVDETWTIPTGTQVRLVATAAGVPDPTFVFTKNGASVGTGSLLTIASLSALDAGVYQATATNTAGSATSDKYTIVVSPATTPPPPVVVPPVSSLPVFTVHPSSQQVEVGAPVVFSATATGAITYQWKRNGSIVAGATRTTFELPATTIADANSWFTSTATNASGSATSNLAMLWVVVPPVVIPPVPPPVVVPPPPVAVAPTITTSPLSQTVLKKANVTFSVVATGTPPLALQWYRQGVAIPGATKASITFTNVNPSYTGKVLVTVNNSAGGLAAEATLTVK